MRTWGRVYNEDGTYRWEKVETTPDGLNDYVYATAICQTLKLNLNESPIYGDWGIPAHPSVVAQLPPDYYTTLTQRRYASHFANLQIVRDQINVDGKPQPHYGVRILTHAGVPLFIPLPY